MSHYPFLEFLLGMAVSATAAFFIAHLALRKFWKGNVTKIKLACFVAVFMVFFIAINIVLLMFFAQPFSR